MFREDGDGARAASGTRSAAGTHDAARRMVDTACGGGDRAPVIRGLRHVGRVPKWPLPLWPLSLSVLFSGNFWRLAARMAGSQARVVARVAPFLAGAPDSAVPRAVPRHLLLLSRCLL